MADPAGVIPPVHVAESAVIDAVLDLLADAIVADVIDVSRDNGLVPQGTEPSGAAVSEHLDDVPDVPERMPEERRPDRGAGGKKQRAPGRVSVVARA